MGKLIRLRNVSLVESLAFEGDAPPKRRTAKPKADAIGWRVQAPGHESKFFRGVSRAEAVKAYTATTGPLPSDVRLKVEPMYRPIEEPKAAAESLDTTATRLLRGPAVAPTRPKALALVESRANRPKPSESNLNELANRVMSGSAW